jgi:phosphoadenosine phosphosulfate reductase
MAPNPSVDVSLLQDEKEDDYYNWDFDYELSGLNAVNRIRKIVDKFGTESVTVLTSFGVQSGVMLSLVAEACPDIRVLYINTQGPTSERDLGYGRKLLKVLGLNNFTEAKAAVTRDEFREGLEEIGIREDEDKHLFHKLSQDVFKVAPLKQECAASGVKCLLSGVRRGQTSSRDNFNFIQFPFGDPAKAHPILDWTDDQCLAYLELNNIPPHPELKSVLVDVPISSESSSEVVKEPLKSYHRKSSLRSRRPSRGEGMECGIHVQTDTNISSGNNPVPAMPNMVVGKPNCRFCKAAKALLAELDINYIEAPVHIFSHLIPAGTTTVPVIYLDKQLIGGYGKLCEHLDVEDTLNTK